MWKWEDTGKKLTFREMADDEIWGTSVYEPPNASASPLSKEIYERAKVPFL